MVRRLRPGSSRAKRSSRTCGRCVALWHGVMIRAWMPWSAEQLSTDYAGRHPPRDVLPGGRRRVGAGAAALVILTRNTSAGRCGGELHVIGRSSMDTIPISRAKRLDTTRAETRSHPRQRYANLACVSDVPKDRHEQAQDAGADPAT